MPNLCILSAVTLLNISLLIYPFKMYAKDRISSPERTMYLFYTTKRHFVHVFSCQDCHLFHFLFCKCFHLPGNGSSLYLLFCPKDIPAVPVSL